MHNPAEPILDFYSCVWHLTCDDWKSGRGVAEQAYVFLHGLSMRLFWATQSRVIRSLTRQLASKREEDPGCHSCHILLVKVSQKASPFKKAENRPAPLMRGKVARVYKEERADSGIFGNKLSKLQSNF